LWYIETLIFTIVKETISRQGQQENINHKTVAIMTAIDNEESMSLMQVC
jgi:hypothetical protein